MKALIIVENTHINIETPYQELSISPIHTKKLVKSIKDGVVLPEFESIFGQECIVELKENQAKKGRPPIFESLNGKIYKVRKHKSSINFNLVNNYKKKYKKYHNLPLITQKMYQNFFNKIDTCKTHLKFYVGLKPKTIGNNKRLYGSIICRNPKIEPVNNRYLSVNKELVEINKEFVVINAFYEFKVQMPAYFYKDSMDLYKERDLSDFILQKQGKFVVYLKQFNKEDVQNLKGLTNFCFPEEGFQKKLLARRGDYENMDIPTSKYKPVKIHRFEFELICEVDRFFSSFEIEGLNIVESFHNKYLVSSIEKEYFERLKKNDHQNNYQNEYEEYLNDRENYIKKLFNRKLPTLDDLQALTAEIKTEKEEVRTYQLNLIKKMKEEEEERRLKGEVSGMIVDVDKLPKKRGRKSKKVFQEEPNKIKLARNILSSFPDAEKNLKDFTKKKRGRKSKIELQFNSQNEIKKESSISNEINMNSLNTNSPINDKNDKKNVNENEEKIFTMEDYFNKSMLDINNLRKKAKKTDQPCLNENPYQNDSNSFNNSNNLNNLSDFNGNKKESLKNQNILSNFKNKPPQQIFNLSDKMNSEKKNLLSGNADKRKRSSFMPFFINDEENQMESDSEEMNEFEDLNEKGRLPKSFSEFLKQRQAEGDNNMEIYESEEHEEMPDFLI